MLDELEDRLAQWKAALEGHGPYPGDFCWPTGLGRCPAHLGQRARRISAAQRDLEVRMAARRSALGALLRRDPGTGRPAATPLFVDQRC